MAQDAIPIFVRDGLAELEIVAPASLPDRLARYLDLVLTTNEKFNLTAVRDRDQAWQRLILDSLTLVAGLVDLPEGAKLIDVGSGPGVPGIPIAMAMPGLKVTLLEATGKKARFLEQCVATLELTSVHVVNDRAETVGQQAKHRQAYDAAVARGVGPLNRGLEYMLPLVRVGGRVLTLKGSEAQQELDEAADAMATLGAGELQVVDAYPQDRDPNTVIVSLIKERPTPKTYPRLPGVPKRSPL